MEPNAALAVVRAWQDAANAPDLDRLVALSDPEIEVVGPRGAGRGHQLLRDWLGRAGLTLTTRQAFARGNAVVLAQHGVWRSPETGAVVGEADLASRFRVDDGRVVQFARHDDLEAALRDAGLIPADEIAAPGPNEG